MEAYAVIETGGKQYRVQQGDVVSVELIEDAEAGQTVEIGPLPSFIASTRPISTAAG